jgi:Na+/proline symporter
LESLAKAVSAAVLTLPLGVIVYRVLYWNRLTQQQQGLARTGRESRAMRIVTGVTAGLIVVFGTATSIGKAPFWALLLMWAATWPLAAGSYGHWSLDLLRRSPERWQAVISGEESPDTKSVLLHLLVAALPGVVFISIWGS